MPTTHKGRAIALAVLTAWASFCGFSMACMYELAELAPPIGSDD